MSGNARIVAPCRGRLAVPRSTPPYNPCRRHSMRSLLVLGATLLLGLQGQESQRPAHDWSRFEDGHARELPHQDGNARWFERGHVHPGARCRRCQGLPPRRIVRPGRPRGASAGMADSRVRRRRDDRGRWARAALHDLGSVGFGRATRWLSTPPGWRSRAGWLSRWSRAVPPGKTRCPGWPSRRSRSRCPPGSSEAVRVEGTLGRGEKARRVVSWLSPDVPGTAVKTILEGDGTKMTFELVEFSLGR